MNTVRMMTPSGKIADVPADKVKAAEADGLVSVVRMATPSGKIADIPTTKIAEAEADGLKAISNADFSKQEKDMQKRERIATAPESVGGAIARAASERSFTPLRAFRERNVAEGEAVMAKTEQLMKENPKMRWFDAYKAAGGQVNTGMPPLALTRASFLSSPAAKTVGGIIAKSAAGVGRAGWNAIKNIGKGAAYLGGALGADYVGQQVFGTSPIRSVIGDVTGTPPQNK